MTHSIEQELRQTYATLQEEYPKLEGVPLKVNGRLKSTLGRARFNRSRFAYEPHPPREIELARFAVESPELHDEARNTLRHEVAHVIAGHEAGHGPRWKAACLQVGARPERCADLTDEQREAHAAQSNPKWTVECRACGVKAYKARATRKVLTWARCRKCEGPMHYTNNRTGEVTVTNADWPEPVRDPLAVMLGELGLR